MLDTTSEWGLVSSVQQPKLTIPGNPSKLKLPVEKIASTLAEQSTPVRPANGAYNPVAGSFVNNSRPNNRTTAPRIPKFNRTRIVNQTAAKAIAPKYATWLASEEYQDHLKQQSYVKDQQAVIPGKLPAAPVYGPSRELQLKVSPNFPTVYAQRITLSDFYELMDENQTLRNKVLERMWACDICNTSFKNHNNTSIRKHKQEHIEQMQDAGECPLCGSTAWVFLSMDQKRTHLQWHTAKEISAAVQGFWREFQCPACDKGFSTMRPESIIDHCLKHIPDVVQYCDKCGLHEYKCTKEELIHHRQVCRDAPERKNNDPEPIFCESCGKDTSSQTEILKALHARDCHSKRTASSKIFCTKCGLDISTFNNARLARHTSRCVVPRGVKRKFCSRCSMNLSELDSTDKSNHKRSCRPNKLPKLSLDSPQFTGSLVTYLPNSLKIPNCLHSHLRVNL